MLLLPRTNVKWTDQGTPPSWDYGIELNSKVWEYLVRGQFQIEVSFPLFGGTNMMDTARDPEVMVVVRSWSEIVAF